MTFGRNYEAIYTKSKLDRPIEQIQERVAQLLAQCNDVLARNNTDMTGKNGGVVKENGKREEDSDKDDDDDKDDELKKKEEAKEIKESENINLEKIKDNEKDQKEQKEIKEETENKLEQIKEEMPKNEHESDDMDIEQPHAEQPQAEQPPSEEKITKEETTKNPFSFIESVHTARKILKRVQFLDEITNVVLAVPDLHKRLRRANLKEMPTWWTPGHDIQVLRAVSEEGLGNIEFLQDNQHPFFTAFKDAVSTKKKRKFLKKYLGEISPLLQRLKHLRKLSLDELKGKEKEALDEEEKNGEELDQFYRPYRTGPRDRRKKRAEFEESKPEDGKEGDNSLPCKLNFKNTTRVVKRGEHGKPLLPIQAKGSTIINLGTILWDSPSFHNKKYIYPLNFESTRKLPSVKFREQYTQWHSKIVQGAKGVEFWVFAEDDPENINKHSTSSGVWVDTLKKN